jgi:hypothetical protein
MNAKLTVEFKPHEAGGFYADFKFEGTSWNGWARNVVLKNLPREYKKFQAELARKGVREQWQETSITTSSTTTQEQEKESLGKALQKALKPAKN